MKAGIVTIKELVPNFGNSLQNYATVKILERMTIEAITLCFEFNQGQLQKIRQKEWLQRHIGYRLPGHKDYWKYTAARILNFDKFSRKYCPYQFVSSTEGLKQRFDYFAVGSDQVWNPNWYRGSEMKRNMYLLAFADADQKVCISPSFGIAKLPESWADYFGRSLSEFPYLSVREQSGAAIIQNLTGRNAEVIIDPTLMLDAGEWRKIMMKPKKFCQNTEYLLTYFLGQKSDELTKYICEVSEKYNLKIINLLDKENYELYISGPSEFLYLIDHASLVLTDSFHACVFSFLLERPFEVFKRTEKGNDMFSRIETLLETFLLKRKYAGNGLDNDIMEHDYGEGFEKLKAERAKAESFYQKAFFGELNSI